MLIEKHRHELERGSAIDAEVIEERGYSTLDYDHRDRLQRLGIRVRSKQSFPGLLLPMYRATGENISAQFKPATPLVIKGNEVKYLSPARSPSRLDVHPRNQRHVRDADRSLVITEGLKKADSLTSRGCVTVAMSGVYNWRHRLGTLGDWEDVPLNGREVLINFDADANSNRLVARAMVRLSQWLRSKGARPKFLITPNVVNGIKTKGADDFFAAGGSLEAFLAAATTKAPDTETFDDTFTDSRLAETIADEVLAESFVWCKGLGWMQWTGIIWTPVSEECVCEAVRLYCLQRFADAVKTNQSQTIQKGWHAMLSAGKQRGVLLACRGIVECDVSMFDADPELLNTPSGVVDLRTGDVTPHDPTLYLTKMTRGSYRPGFTHEDWQQALSALPDEDTRAWYQARLGQAATGHRTPDGVIVFNQGSGENGKTLLTSDGVAPALGDFAAPASPKLITSSDEHSTERADLRGQRLLIGEELTEDRALNVTVIKQIQDVSTIKARYIRRDNITFETSHSLFVNTNYRPLVKETDHGTWRRMAMVPFPFTFKKPHEPLENPNDRVGDPRLKERIKAGAEGRHDAIVTWIVEGARRFFADGFPPPPAAVEEATRAWRREADRVQDFWDAQLVADKDRCIWTIELLETFNQHLVANGHKPWSKETFHPRFQAHTETARHGVVVARPKNRERLKFSWPEPECVNGERAKLLPVRPDVYLGVRFRTPEDDAAENGQTAKQLEIPRETNG